MRAALRKLPVSRRGSAFTGAEHSGSCRVQLRVWRERGGQPTLPSARSARFARRRVRSFRADPASLTRTFASPPVEPGGVHSPFAVSIETGLAMSVAPSRVDGFNHSIVQSGPCIASRCARCRTRASFDSGAFARTARRATNEQDGASRAHGPDAQYHQPLFHFTSPLEPRTVFMCVPCGRDHPCSV